MTEALEDLKKALLNDKLISKLYGVCEKIVEILANIINRIFIGDKYMGKPLTSNEKKEIRVIMNKLEELYDEALETKYCGNENELCKMVLSNIPMIEQSYKNFVERGVING